MRVGARLHVERVELTRRDDRANSGCIATQFFLGGLENGSGMGFDGSKTSPGSR